ncbi:hypothetical protein ABVT39_009602, partial [Epinephelus coioides]
LFMLQQAWRSRQVCVAPLTGTCSADALLGANADLFIYPPLSFSRPLSPAEAVLAGVQLHRAVVSRRSMCRVFVLQ